MSRRPSLHNPFQQAVVPEVYSDSRSHGLQGPSRHVRVPQATSVGGGAISKSEDGTRCVVAGRESLRILRMSEPNSVHSSDHKSFEGPGGYRIEASRNLWVANASKVDSTDVAWCHGSFSNKILTSARNGELLMWDLNKSGPSKYERKARQHLRSIHMLGYSPVLQNYCITGSADGDLRVWDLRDLRDSIMKIRHPVSVRSVIFSPVHWQPRHAITGLDNGNIYRWDLNMGQRGQLDRIPLAHAGPVLALDWHHPASTTASSNRNSGTSSSQGTNWYSGVGGGLFDDLGGYGAPAPVTDGEASGMGWLATGGLDRTVKVWDITSPAAEAHISRKPKYTLHTSFPVRRVSWRPNYECELAVSSYLDHTASSQSGPSLDRISTTAPGSPRLSFASLSEHRGNNGSKTHSKMGDPIEIWDVRRGYVAKWVLRNSAVEGGVTDMVFADPHSLWAQHFSGAFSQFDVRSSTKMIDSIPRHALAWDAAGSLLFVTDRPKRWDIPYDDVNPERRSYVKRKLKALGDKPYFPTSQTICTMTGHELSTEPETFVKLAQGYRFEGDDRPSICAHNAEVAYQAGRPEAAQTWLFISSLLTEIVPTEVPEQATSLSPLPFANPRLPHSTSAPASIPTVSHPLPSHPVRSFSEDVYPERTSPSPLPPSSSASSSRHAGNKGRTYSSSTFSLNSDKDILSPLRTTPASSTTPSPHRPAMPLPPLGSSVSGSALNRRSSNVGNSSTSTRPRISSSYRRPSFNVQSLLASESDSRNQSHLSLRHVGEGALDDSDSEASGSGGEVDVEEATNPSDTEQASRDDNPESSLDRPSVLRVGSTPFWNSRSTSVQPSPLSRVAGQQTWTEDEKEEDDSPSPASTDSDSDHGAHDIPPFRPISRRNSSRRSSARSTRNKARSRSSTVASLAVSTNPSPLARQPSHSSVRTVTPTPTPTSARGFEREMAQKASAHGSNVKQEEVVRSVPGSSKYANSISSAQRIPETASVRSTSFHSQSRPHSDVFSNDGDPDASREFSSSRGLRSRCRTQEMYNEDVKRSEARLRETAWEALKETLEVYADEGDVQMCAMLSLVAPGELSISGRRAVRFVESYLELLMRMRLHTVAAYIRKHVPADDLKQTTEVQTTLYTLCGKCRKPVLQPISHGDNPRRYGTFAYCSSCKNAITKCSICRLPVRALLFQCAVCMHGGHQECYQKYYLHRPPIPMKDITNNRSPTQARPVAAEPRLRRAASKTGEDEGSDDGREPEEGNGTIRDVALHDGKKAIEGHPCAAGCGHFCWATNERTSVDSP